MDYENVLALKTLYPSPPGPFASLGMAHLSLEVSFCSFFVCAFSHVPLFATCSLSPC